MTIQKKLDEFFNSSHAVQVDDGSWYYHCKPVETELSELYQRIAELEQAIAVAERYIDIDDFGNYREDVEEVAARLKEQGE